MMDCNSRVDWPRFIVAGVPVHARNTPERCLTIFPAFGVMKMARQNWFQIVCVALLAIAGGLRNSFGDETPTPAGTPPASASYDVFDAKAAAANEKEAATNDATSTKAAAADSAQDEGENVKAASRAADSANAVDVFGAVNKGQVEMKFIARSSHAARVILTNKTKQPLTVRLPEAFAGVPVLAQRQGGGGGGGHFGGGGGQFGGGGGQNPGVGGGAGGGGLGGGGGRGFGGGGGGGIFSIPPEQTAKLDVEVICLDHGLRDPSSSKLYQMVPIEQHVNRPAVVELLKALGRGELQHGAAQAAAWHLNNDIPWQALATKLQGTVRSTVRPPYFSQYEIQAGMAYSGEAARRGQLAQLQNMNSGNASFAASSEAVSTAPDHVTAPASEAAPEKPAAKTDAKQRTRRVRPAARQNTEKARAATDPATQL